MRERVREFPGYGLIIRFDRLRCIHAEECVRRLRPVFDPERKPWIDPGRGSPAAIAETVRQCPTGALHVARDDGVTEPAPATNTVTLSRNGPLFARGDIRIVAPDGTELLRDTRVALCRCGESHHKPLCDGRHRSAGFRDSGRVTRAPRPAEDASPGPLVITVAAHGPFVLAGPYRLVEAEGTASDTAVSGALCRCGHSTSKPLCDGSHIPMGFRD